MEILIIQISFPPLALQREPLSSQLLDGQLIRETHATLNKARR